MYFDYTRVIDYYRARGRCNNQCRQHYCAYPAYVGKHRSGDISLGLARLTVLPCQGFDLRLARKP
jgi:hypothetical protein